jgi:hypothetical protein
VIIEVEREGKVRYGTQITRGLAERELDHERGELCAAAVNITSSAEHPSAVIQPEHGARRLTEH